LRDEKLLDDRRYVVNFVTYHADRGHGALRVRAKLRRLGIDGEIVEECLSAFGDWAGSAERARRKKFGAMRPTIPADQQRQARFLAHRGFTGTEIGAAVGVDTELELDQELI
jgi:SOS response regulatory protein OraA/RecX